MSIGDDLYSINSCTSIMITTNAQGNISITYVINTLFPLIVRKNHMLSTHQNIIEKAFVFLRRNDCMKNISLYAIIFLLHSWILYHLDRFIIAICNLFQNIITKFFYECT